MAQIHYLNISNALVYINKIFKQAQFTINNTLFQIQCLQ